ncbi:MAG: helix-turn-helix domain-containing protein [Erythrobacter sp.]|nr:helix-turn-helix domain-containing protein [Erythrobacter sp.]
MDNARTRYEALIACRDHAGSDSQMGRDLGIPQSTMWRIINSSKQLPAEHVLRAEALYGVSRHDLRPDIYPRSTMTDANVGQRFEGVDRRAAVGMPHAGHSTRVLAAGEFNRPAVSKAAAR